MPEQSTHNSKPDIPRPDGTLRVLQITDCHLHADPNWALAGINTQQSFESVMALIEDQPPDLLLLTGDLVHDASQAGYRRLSRYIDQLGIATYALPGNHDAPPMLAAHIQGTHISTPRLLTVGQWTIILLDSTRPDSEGGRLSNGELVFLEQTLENHADRHILIALHHHPVPVNSAWMDKMALDNPESFFAIIDRHPQVRGVIWGHIHQAFDSLRNGVRLLGTPSTCIQFITNQDNFGISTEPPGYRWLELKPDGTLQTGVERAAALPPGLDLKTGGY